MTSICRMTVALLAVACTVPDQPLTTFVEESSMRVVSSAFAEGDLIPVRFTCDGEDISPPLAIDGIPEEAQALVLIVDDPDAPRGTWDHWVVYDIPIRQDIPEAVTDLGTDGRNSWGDTGYGGPCPPSGTHRYYFRVYALTSPLGIAEGASKEQVLAAAEGKVMAEATLMGRFGR